MVKPCEAIAFVEQPCIPKGLWAVNALHLPLWISSISNARSHRSNSCRPPVSRGKLAVIPAASRHSLHVLHALRFILGEATQVRICSPRPCHGKAFVSFGDERGKGAACSRNSTNGWLTCSFPKTTFRSPPLALKWAFESDSSCIQGIHCTYYMSYPRWNIGRGNPSWWELSTCPVLSDYGIVSFCDGLVVGISSSSSARPKIRRL